MRKSVDNVNHVDSAPAVRGKAASAEAVIELLHELMHQFRSRQHQALRDGAHGVTPMEGKALGFFSRHPGATLSDLVAHSGRDKAQLARLVKGLRERGLLSAEADAEDRRNVRLRLSEAGIGVQRALHDEVRRLNVLAVAALDAAERAQLIALLGRLKANLGQLEK